MKGTAIGTKMAPLYAIIFLGDLKERFFSDCDISLLVWWRYIFLVAVFLCFGNMVKKSLRSSEKFLLPITPPSSSLQIIQERR